MDSVILYLFDLSHESDSGKTMEMGHTVHISGIGWPLTAKSLGITCQMYMDLQKLKGALHTDSILHFSFMYLT